MKRFQILKIKIVFILLTIVVGVSTQSYAQQDALYSQYMFNTMAINPAYAGSRDVLSITALGRYQWIGVEGAPTTYTFSADMPIKNERMGLGLQVYNDEIGGGVERRTGANFSYAYKVRLTPRTTMSLGTQAGFTNYNLDLESIRQTLYNQNDQAFLGKASFYKPNAGLGLYISNDRAYFGISVPEIVEYKLKSSVTANDLGFTTHRSYFAMMGFVTPLNESLKLKPSLMFRYQQGTPLSMDANLNLWIRDKIALGVSGRFNQIKSYAKESIGSAVIGLLEVQISPQMRLGYAYDHQLNNINKTHKFGATQTHEILLRYEFGYGKDKILTPRYF